MTLETNDPAGKGGAGVQLGGEPGSYSRKAPAKQSKAGVTVQRIMPADLGPAQACAAMLQGMTAHYLTVSTFPLGPGKPCLVHAAAGGVGLLLCQLGRRAGARVIGTTSTDEKAAAARAAGADEVIRYDRTDFAAETMKLTGGVGVDVVYDSVGVTTFEGSLRCLAPRGMLALFGQSSGSVPPFDPKLLAAKSLFMTRPSLVHYTATAAELRQRADEVLSWVTAGELALKIDREVPLADAAEAHRLLESRATSGKLLLAV